MKAVRCTVVGSLGDLVVEEMVAPSMRPACVRVAVEAAGLNYVDALFVQGRYQLKPAPPFTPGSELAGTVIEVADDVESISVGERVIASVGLGGFAEQVVLPAEQVTRIPSGLSSTAAATLTQSFCTALFALEHRARVVRGETVLVIGGGGGVGHAAIQVAVALGADVIATASTPQKVAHAQAAGASTVIDPDPEHLKDAIRASAPKGVDIVVDPVGDVATEPALRALREGGRLLIIGFAGGQIPTLATNLILLRNRSVVGVDWGAWGMAHPREQASLLAEILAMVAEGQLRPPEPTLYTLDEASIALEDLLGRRVTGKAALVMSR